MIYNLLTFLIALCCILFYIIWKTKKNSKHKNNLSSFEGLEILILSGTETGNARKLAENLNKALAIDDLMYNTIRLVNLQIYPS